MKMTYLGCKLPSKLYIDTEYWIYKVQLVVSMLWVHVMCVHVSTIFAFTEMLLVFTCKYIYIFMRKVFPTRRVVLRKKQMTVLATDKV